MPISLRATSMLEVNEFLVLDYVRERAETTRVEIAEDLSLSASSVSRIIRRLQAAGAVRELPGSSSGGRPRAVVAFNAQAGAVLGVDLGGTKCHGVVADLAGSLLAEEIQPTQQAGAPSPTLLAVIDALTARAAELDQPVTALAVGIPAYIDPDTGLATGGPNVHWQGYALSADLAGHVSAPFLVDNDANLAALGHAWRGNARDCRDYVVMNIGTGIGAGVVVDGQLARGRRNAAGEVGYLVLSPGQLSERHAEALGGFERFASGPSLAARAEDLLRGSDVPSALRSMPMTTETVLAAALAGDAVGLRVLEPTLERVAMAVIAIAAVTNPERVILDGSVGRAFAPWCGRLTELVAPHLPDPPEIVISSLGPNATTLGAVAAGLQLTRRQREPAHLAGSFDVAFLQRKRGPGMDVA